MTIEDLEIYLCYFWCLFTHFVCLLGESPRAKFLRMLGVRRRTVIFERFEKLMKQFWASLAGHWKISIRKSLLCMYYATDTASLCIENVPTTHFWDTHLAPCIDAWSFVRSREHLHGKVSSQHSVASSKHSASIVTTSIDSDCTKEILLESKLALPLGKGERGIVQSALPAYLILRCETLYWLIIIIIVHLWTLSVSEATGYAFLQNAAMFCVFFIRYQISSIDNVSKTSVMFKTKKNKQEEHHNAN